jgi:hypothetical protein
VGDGHIHLNAAAGASTVLAGGRIIATRNGGFNLHVAACGDIAFRKVAEDSWTPVDGGQRALREGNGLCISDINYVCRLPAEQQTTAQAAGSAAPSAHNPTEELLELTARGALLRNEITSGL